MPSSAISYGSSLEIAEVRPAGPGFTPRKLILVGGGLPFQGAEWGSTTKVKTTWFPGNSEEATQQVLGGTLMPSTWKGAWRRTHLGRLPCIYADEQGYMSRIASPMVMREIMETIQSGGIRLRVTWSVNGTSYVGNPRDKRTVQQNYKIVREGLLTSFKTPIQRHTDIEWEAEFTWASRGADADTGTTNVRQDNDLANAATNLQASVIALEKRVFPPDLDKPKTLTLGKLDQIANAPLKAVRGTLRGFQSIVSDFKNAGDILATAVNQPFAIAKAVSDLANNTIAQGNRFLDEMGRAPPEGRTTKPTVSSTLRATNYINRVAAQVEVCVEEGAKVRDRVRQSSFPLGNRAAVTRLDSSRSVDILAIHSCKEGDTPIRLSIRFYRSPDFATAILRANRMPLFTPVFVPGTMIVIPTLTNSAAQRTRTV